MKRIELKSCKAFKIGKIKFEANIHLILEVFLPVFLSKIIFICIATSHSSGVRVNTVFPVIDKAMRGVQAKPGFVYKNCIKLTGHGGGK